MKRTEKLGKFFENLQSRELSVDQLPICLREALEQPQPSHVTEADAAEKQLKPSESEQAAGPAAPAS